MEEFTYRITPEEEEERIDKWISNTLKDLSRSYIQKLIKDHCVGINGNFDVKSKTAVSTSDLITLHWQMQGDQINGGNGGV